MRIPLYRPCRSLRSWLARGSKLNGSNGLKYTKKNVNIMVEVKFLLCTLNYSEIKYIVEDETDSINWK